MAIASLAWVVVIIKIYPKCIRSNWNPSSLIRMHQHFSIIIRNISYHIPLYRYITKIHFQIITIQYNCRTRYRSVLWRVGSNILPMGTEMSLTASDHTCYDNTRIAAYPHTYQSRCQGVAGVRNPLQNSEFRKIRGFQTLSARLLKLESFPNPFPSYQKQHQLHRK